MRCKLRGVRITYSPRSCVVVRVYRSIARVSLPSRVMKAPESCTATASVNSSANMKSLQLRDADRRDFVVAFDGVDDVHALGDLPEHGVHAVQVPLRRVADEELTAARVLARMRHRQCARDVLVRVLLRFALDGVTGPARSHRPLAGLGVGVAALDHEVRNHAMEFGAVVEA